MSKAKPVIHYDEAKVAEVGARIDGARQSNLSLDKLADTRVTRMLLTPSLRRSKVAWKFAMLRQGLTWRLVDLAEGAIREWNEERYLPAMILARSFLETAALVHAINQRMRAAIDSRNLVSLNDIAETEMIGARLQDWIDKDGYKSTNVLTVLQKMDKAMPGIWRHYEHMSEMAHPNGRGTVQFFARVDRTTAEVDFSPTMHSPVHMFDMVQGALILLDWSVCRLAEIDAMVEEVSQLQVDLNDDLGISG